MNPNELIALLQSNPALAQLLRTSAGAGASATGAAPNLLAALGGGPGIALSFLPALLSLLGGDPTERLRSRARDISSPQHLFDLQQQILRRLGATPENVAGRANIVNQSTSLTNDLSRSLAARGLGTTGIAAVAQPIARSAVSGRLANFEGQLSSGALGHARTMVERELANLYGTPPGQSRFQVGLDKGLSALLPAVGDYYKNRYRAPIARIA